jgi:hypothetical protein
MVPILLKNTSFASRAYQTQITIGLAKAPSALRAVACLTSKHPIDLNPISRLGNGAVAICGDILMGEAHDIGEGEGVSVCGNFERTLVDGTLDGRSHTHVIGEGLWEFDLSAARLDAIVVSFEFEDHLPDAIADGERFAIINLLLRDDIDESFGTLVLHQSTVGIACAARFSISVVANLGVGHDAVSAVESLRSQRARAVCFAVDAGLAVTTRGIPVFTPIVASFYL